MEIKTAQADSDSYSCPASYKVQNLNRMDAGLVDLGAIITSQQLRLVAVALPSGFVLTKMGWFSGTTALGTPTNYWACLLDPALKVLATSTDLLTAAWAANTLKNFTFTSLTLRRPPGLYYAGLVVKATTPPSLLGTIDAHAIVATQAPILSGNSSTAGLSVPGDLVVGTTAGAITASAVKPYVVIG